MFFIRSQVRRHLRVWITAILASTTLIVASGASVASGSTSGIAQAQSVVNSFYSLPKWTAPGPTVNAALAKGKTCAYIPVASGITFTNASYASFQAAAKVVGIKTKFFSTAGSPSTWSQAIDEAVSLHVACIVTQGVNLSILQSAMKQAKAAKIPVIESFVREPSQGPPSGAFAEVSPNCSKIGTALGAYAVVKSKGHINATIFTSSDSPCSTPLVAGIKSEMKKSCGSACQTVTVDVPVADWASKLPEETSSALTARPTTNWLFPLYDGEMGYIIPSVKQAGKSSSVLAGSYNASPGIVNDIVSHDVLAADVGTPYLWYGYALMDEALRAMTGMRAASGTAEQIPVVLFDSHNFTASVAAKSSNDWYGTAGAAIPGDFKKLWGLKG